MLRTTIIAVIMLTSTVGPISADVLYTDPRPQEQSSGTWLVHGDIELGKLAAVILDTRLTFVSEKQDSDKDGFIDTRFVAITNPNGYVVFHFRSIWRNERVTLGHFLAVEGMGPLTLSTGGGYSGAPLSSIIFGGELELLDPTEPGFDYDPSNRDDPLVPEPATMAMLAIGSIALIRRRRVPASLS